jgi:hypothetical protein
LQGTCLYPSQGRRRTSQQTTWTQQPRCPCTLSAPTGPSILLRKTERENVRTTCTELVHHVHRPSSKVSLNHMVGSANADTMKRAKTIAPAITNRVIPVTHVQQGDAVASWSMLIGSTKSQSPGNAFVLARDCS